MLSAFKHLFLIQQEVPSRTQSKKITQLSVHEEFSSFLSHFSRSFSSLYLCCLHFCCFVPSVMRNTEDNNRYNNSEYIMFASTRWKPSRPLCSWASSSVVCSVQWHWSESDCRVSDWCPAPRLRQCITPHRPVVRDIPQSNTAFSLAHTLRTWEGKGPTEHVQSHTAGLAPVRWFFFCRFDSWADGLCRCAFYDIVDAFNFNMRWSVF